MYYLWKRTPHGSIKISSDGLSGFVDRFLSEKFRCCSLFLAGGESASVTLVLCSDNASLEGTKVEEKISSIVAPLGFGVQIIWVDREGLERKWGEALFSLLLNPWSWMLLVTVIVVAITAGLKLKGLFWALFWGTVAWFVSKFAIAWAVRRKPELFSFPVRR